MNRPDELTGAALIEAGLVLALGFGVMARVPDLTPIVRHFTGLSFGPPDFAMVDPFYPLLRGVLAVCLFAYALRVLVPRPRWGQAAPGSGGTRDRWLGALLWILIVLALVPPTARDMFDRSLIDEAPGNTGRYRSHTHDGGVLQTELAMEALLRGENPYALDYENTAMSRAKDSDPAGWRRLGYDRNPALGHVPYLPASFLLPLPVRAGSRALWSWYDQRLFYLFAGVLFVWACGRLVEPGRARRVVWSITGLSPLLLPFYRIGRNDVVLLALVALTALALRGRRAVLAGVLLGLACAMKQFAWVLGFFFVVWVIRDPSWRGTSAKRSLAAMGVSFGLCCLPFVLLSPGDFFEDVVAFNLGLSDDAYPLRPDSLGLASLALGLGWATELRQGFPMWVFQALITLPLTAILTVRLWRRPGLAAMFLAAGVVVFSALFCSAFFAFNYWAVPVYLLMLAYLAGQWTAADPHPG